MSSHSRRSSEKNEPVGGGRWEEERGCEEEGADDGERGCVPIPSMHAYYAGLSTQFEVADVIAVREVLS